MPRWPALLLAALAPVVLPGCAAPAADTSTTPYTCLLPSEHRMLVAELFFGRNIRGRAPLSDAEWADFATQIVTSQFPDGFTAMDGSGQWQNPATRQIAHEPTKILLIAADRAADLAQRLTTVIDAYKERYHQQSVGIITRDSCGAF
ncbi:MAG TPA: DUF3574 domain-containing protein [Stellaceae bacterium]|jgi:hypothetical protein|nr:DUF3574 domain-containing protein [Stellaceae bacterium]